MRPTLIQPTVRWGMVPFGAAIWTMPSAKAVIAAMEWSAMAGGASSSGARIMARNAEDAFDRRPRSLRARHRSRRDGNSGTFNIRAGRSHPRPLAAAARLGLVPGGAAGHGSAGAASDPTRDARPAGRLSDLDIRDPVRGG